VTVYPFRTIMPPLNIPSNSDIRITVVRLYEQARQDNTQPFDPDRFLAFLSHPPAAKGKGVLDTFAGRYRLVRFFHAVQLEFGICFSNSDWDTGFTLDRFVERIAAKMKNPVASRRRAAERLAEARGGGYLGFSILGLPFAIAAAAIENRFVRIPLALICIAIMIYAVVLNVKEYRFAKKLLKRIDGNLP